MKKMISLNIFIGHHKNSHSSYFKIMFKLNTRLPISFLSEIDHILGVVKKKTPLYLYMSLCYIIFSHLHKVMLKLKHE